MVLVFGRADYCLDRVRIAGGDAKSSAAAPCEDRGAIGVNLARGEIWPAALESGAAIWESSVVDQISGTKHCREFRHAIIISMSIALSENLEGVDWVRLAEVFERAPLAVRDPAKIQEAFQNSQIRCFVWDKGDLIGAGRALSDGVWTTVILDVVLLPEYQGQGIGTAIMKFLTERSKAAKVLLYSAPGKEGFYAKLGYRKLKTAMAKYAEPELEERHHRLGFIE
jgi:aralkylamine N-acetyltransferase